MPAIRPAVPADLPVLTALYNHSIVHTPITFDLAPFEVEQRRPWFDEHSTTGRHRLLVSQDADGSILGYASTSRWRAKAAYDPTVESSVYVGHHALGPGLRAALYSALFDAPAGRDIHTILAGVARSPSARP